MTARRKDMTKAEAIKALVSIGYVEIKKTYPNGYVCETLETSTGITVCDPVREAACQGLGELIEEEKTLPFGLVIRSLRQLRNGKSWCYARVNGYEYTGDSLRDGNNSRTWMDCWDHIPTEAELKTPQWMEE